MVWIIVHVGGMTGEGARGDKSVAKNLVMKSCTCQAVQLGRCPGGTEELQMVFK